MEDNNRVLIRRGARELNEQEVESVTGRAQHTLTACTWIPQFGADGDARIGEC